MKTRDIHKFKLRAGFIFQNWTLVQSDVYEIWKGKMTVSPISRLHSWWSQGTQTANTGRRKWKIENGQTIKIDNICDFVWLFRALLPLSCDAANKFIVQFTIDIIFCCVWWCPLAAVACAEQMMKLYCHWQSIEIDFGRLFHWFDAGANGSS